MLILIVIKYRKEIKQGRDQPRWITLSFFKEAISELRPRTMRRQSPRPGHKEFHKEMIYQVQREFQKTEKEHSGTMMGRRPGECK